MPGADRRHLAIGAACRARAGCHHPHLLLLSVRR
jgi:hypothetical protein